MEGREREGNGKKWKGRKKNGTKKRKEMYEQRKEKEK